MENWNKLAYDHEQTTKYFHALADTRFKLLAFVPLVTGGAVVALSPAISPVQTGLLGIFGFLVTLGITFYDRRNTQIYDAITDRAKSLEALMALPRLARDFVAPVLCFTDPRECSNCSVCGRCGTTAALVLFTRRR